MLLKDFNQKITEFLIEQAWEDPDWSADSKTHRNSQSKSSNDAKKGSTPQNRTDNEKFPI